MWRTYLIRCMLLGIALFSVSGFILGQTVIYTNPGNSYTDSNGPTSDVYNVNISNCSKVGFSMNFGFSLPWGGNGNMELPSECVGGDPCMGNPANPLQGDCVNCWDFLWAQFFIDGNLVSSDLVGTDAYAVQNGTISLAQTSCLNASTATLAITTQTWAMDESVSFSNISVVCWEKETPAIFTQNPCAGDPLTLLEIGAATPTQWNWSGPAGSYSGNPWIIPNANPSLHDGMYRVTVTDAGGCTSTTSVQVNIDQFFAEMVPGGTTEICLNNCTTVRIATDRMSGSYNYVFGFGGFSDSDSYSTAEEVINVCYDGSGSDPVYNNITNTVHIPTSYSNNSIDLQLIAIQDNSGDMCNGDVIGMPVTIDLVGGISANAPSDYSLCEESIGSMMATFDLTTKDSEVLGMGMGTVNWFSDMGAMIPIMMTTTYQAASTTVYAQVQQGACSSTVVPLNLVVTPGETGNVFFDPLNGNPVCVTDTNGVDVMLEMRIPNGSIEYLVDVDYVVDEITSSTTYSSFNDPVITFSGVKDSLELRITDVNVSGSCSFSGTSTDTTIYVRPAPVIQKIDTIYACGIYILDSIEITNGSGGEAYYNLPNGMGSTLMPGDTITADTLLYVYDNNNGCIVEDSIVFRITPGAFIDSIPDTSRCDFLILDNLTGIGLTAGAGYFTSPGGNGLRFEGGDTIFNSIELFPYDTMAVCTFAQDTFKITIIDSPDLSNISDFGVCEMWIVDSLGLQVDSLLIYTIPPIDTFRIGDTIMNNAILGVEAGRDSCFSYKAINVTISTEVSAGQGRTRNYCLTTTDTVDLFTILDIMSPYTPGGEWQDNNGYGVAIDSNGQVDISSLTAGDYEFQYFVSDSLCGADSTIATVRLFEELNAGRDTSLILCTGMADLITLLQADLGGSFTIIPSASVDFSDPFNVNFAGLSVGLYTIEYAISSPECNSDMATIMLDVRGTADAGTGREVDICEGVPDSIILSGQIIPPSDPGGTWQSITDPGIIISNSNSISMDGVSPGSYEFAYIVDIPMCGMDTATVMVNVTALPDAGVDSTMMSCGEVLNLSSIHGGNPGGYYDMNPPSGIDFTTPSAVDFSGLSVGNYQVNYIDSSGLCTPDTSLFTLMIIPAPDAGIGTMSNSCTGITDSIDLTSLLSGIPDLGGRWESVTDPGVVISPTSNIFLSTEIPGTYEFNYIVENPICDSDTASVMIDLIHTPDAGVDGIIMTCGGIYDVASILGGDLGGTYSITPNVGIDFSDPSAVDITGLTPGAYQVSYVVENAICENDTALIQLDFLSFPNAGTGTMGIACTGIADSLDLSGLLGGSPDGGGRWESITDPGISISNGSMVELSGETPGMYSFEYIVELPICGSDTATVMVEVIQTPDAGTDDVITTCGEILNLPMLHMGDAGGVYSITPSATVDFTNPNAVDVNGLAVDDYEIMYVLDGGMCPSDTSVISLRIVAFPNAGIGTMGTACTGIADSLDLSGLLSGSPDGGGRWESITDPGISISNSAMVELSGETPGMYSFEYIVELPICGSDTATVMIEVIQTPDAGTDDVITTCGEILNLPMMHMGDVGGVYSITPSATVDFTNPNAVDVNGLPVDDYEIMYVVDGGMCPSDTSVISLSIVAFPNAGIGTMGTTCTAIADSLDLSGLLSGSPDGGGRWESITDPGISITNGSMVELSGETPGMYAFDYIVELPICGSDTATVMVEVIKSPNAGNDNSINTCGEIIDFTQLHNGMPGGSYLINPSGTLDFTDPTMVDVSVLTVGTYQVSYIVDHPSCDSDTALIEVVRERVPDAGSGTDIAICEGSQDSLLLNSLLSGQDTNGNWTDMSGSNISIKSNSAIDLTMIAGGSYNFRYEVTTPSCGAAFTDVIVDIISNPFAGRDTMDMICASVIDLASYFPGSNAGGVYDINPTENIDFSDSKSVDLSELSDGNYVVTYSINAPGCPSVSASLTLDVVSPPVAGLDTTLLRCDDPVISFNQVLRGHDSGGRIENGGRSYLIDESVDLDTIGDNTFLYILDGNATCPGDTAVLILDADVFLNAGEDISFIDCDGASIDLQDLLVNADPGGDFIDINQEVLPTSVVTMGQGRTSEFKYITSTRCGSDTAEIVIENIQFNNLSIAVSDGSPCEDDCIDVNINMTGPQELALYYNIEDDLGNRIDTTVLVDGMAPTTIQMCISPGVTLNSGQLDIDRAYTLTVDSLIYENGCLVPFDLSSVPIQTHGDRYGVLDTLVCVGESFTKGNILFTESNPSSDVVLAGMASNFCDSILTVNVTFEDVIFGTLDTSICRGENIVINGTTYSENLTFGQDTFPGASSAGCDSILMVQVNILEPVMGMFSASLCDQDSVITIGDRSFSISDPNGTAFIQGGASNGCDSIVDVSILYLNNAVTQLDTTVCDAQFILDIGGELFDINDNTGQVVYPGAAANGCDSIVEVMVNYDLLDVDYEILPLVCPEDEEWGITITGTDGSLPLEYDIAGLSGVADAFPVTITLNKEDDSNILFTDAMGCTRIDSIEVEIPDSIALEINALRIGSNGYQLRIVTDATPAIIEWNPGIGLSCNDCPDPVASITNDINYEVDIITSLGCEISDTITLRADQVASIYIPNVFSPNEDGTNDFWYLTVAGNSAINIQSVSVYDRWGNIVYQPQQPPVNDPQNGWDGTFSDKKLNPGVYVYQVVYENEEGVTEYITGDITIVH